MIHHISTTIILPTTMSIVAVRVAWDNPRKKYGDTVYNYPDKIISDNGDTYEISWYGQQKTNRADKVGPGTVFFASRRRNQRLSMLGVVKSKEARGIEKPIEYRLLVKKVVLEPLSIPSNAVLPSGPGRYACEAMARCLRVPIDKLPSNRPQQGILDVMHVPEEVKAALVQAIADD